MSDRIDFNSGDVLISRSSNGWILKIKEEVIQGPPLIKVSVYEDEKYGENASAIALSHCLWEAFNEYTKTKKQGGFTFEVKEPNSN